MAHPYKKFNEADAGKARAKHLVKGYAHGGAVKKKGDTNIHIAVISPQGEQKPPAPPMPMPMPAPMIPPPGAGPGGPPPGGMPPGGMMQRGGKVGMSAGAETGKGRLQKAKAYKAK